MGDKIIYYTKEDGHDIFLYTTHISQLRYNERLDRLSDDTFKRFEKALGHPINNLYMLINNREFKLLYPTTI